MGEYFYIIGLLLILYNLAMICAGEQKDFNIDEEFDETDINEAINRLKTLSKHLGILLIELLFLLTQLIFILYGFYHMIISCSGNNINTIFLICIIVALNVATIYYKHNKIRYYGAEHICYILLICAIMAWCYNLC